ncbi:hypothetical protein SHIRM173S_00901 [Streptomyces hirsutus]
MEFEREVRSPNGEDVLYAFHAPGRGRALLLSYNVIRKEVAPPLSCHGWALSEDGALTLLRPDGDEPARVHPLQLWHSPYVSDTHAAGRPVGDGPLDRVGNADLVRGISDCLSLVRSVTETTPTTEVYEALAAACVRTADAHHWLDDAELGDLRGPLEEVRTTAEQVLAEFETVRDLGRRAAAALDEAAARIGSVVRRLRGEQPREAAAWVAGLTELRHAQGHLLTLKEMRYADHARIDELADEAGHDLASFGRRAVTHLAHEDAFAAHHADVERLVADAEQIDTAAEAVPVAARLDELAEGLRTVTEVVAGLDIGDATVRTAVLERVAEALGGVNRARATLDARRRGLRDREARAGFAAELALLGQTVTGALAAAADPEACDEQLTRVLAQLETLESRFAEFDDVLGELADQRTEIYEAFAARKQSLTDARARRAEQLASAAERVLETIARRSAALADTDEVSTYFASDPLVAKVRRTAGELRDLGDRVRAEELDGRLRSARQEAARALRDRTDLYADGGRAIRLGSHRFAVTTQPLDLTLVPHGDGLAFALTGTDYRAPVTDPALAEGRRYWNRHLPSESPEVYRAEHLAARLLHEHGPDALHGADDLAALVRRAAEEAYDEGYERGVHDHDATALLTAVLPLHDGAGLLRHEPAARALALLHWTHGATAEERADLTRRARSFARVRDAFGPPPALADLCAEIARRIGDRADRDVAAGAPARPEAAAAYLFDELTTGPDGFVIGAQTRTLLDKFRRTVATEAYDEDLPALDTLAARRQLRRGLADRVHRRHRQSAHPRRPRRGRRRRTLPGPAPPRVRRAPHRHRGGPARHPPPHHRPAPHPPPGRIPRPHRGVQGPRHPRVPRLPAPPHRPGHRRTHPAAPGRPPPARHVVVRPQPPRRRGLPPAHRGQPRQTARHHRRVGAHRHRRPAAPRLPARLRQDHPHGIRRRPAGPRPGEDQRPGPRPLRDLPRPGRGAERHRTPGDREDQLRAGRRQQHAPPPRRHPAHLAELLQKFIPLCDATRRVEGVWEGEPRTYDLRGKRFAVCMAGNPYTESGDLFRVPDMLANRADVWNLGDVLTGKDDAFAASFIENALTANTVLAPLAGRDRGDLDLLISLAEGDPTVHADRLAHPYAPTELDRVLTVLRHLLTARRTVLAVNEAYIASAAQSDDARTEPPFRLQGSYRNMNKIAQRIQPVMNDAELSAVIDDHYAAEAQTLTTGAEANLLKLAELRGTLTAAQADRWAGIKAAHVRTHALGGPDDDALTRAVAALALLGERIAAVESAITRAADPRRIMARPTTRRAEGDL